MYKTLKNIAGELADCLDSVHETHSYILREVSPCKHEDDLEEPLNMEGSNHEASDISLSELMTEIFEDRLEDPFDNFCGGLFDECEDEGEDESEDESEGKRDETSRGDGEGGRKGKAGKFEGWDILEKKRYEIIDGDMGSKRPIAHIDLAFYSLDRIKICHLSADTSSLFITCAEGEIARHNLKLVAELLNERINERFEDARIFHYADFGCSLFSTVEIERFLSSGDPSLLAESISELASEVVGASKLMKGICEHAEALESKIPASMPLKEKIHHD